jgi:GH18 family chitinase
MGASQQHPDEGNDVFAIAGYLPDYRVTAYMEHQLLEESSFIPPILSDLILFSLQPHSRGFLGGCCLQPHHYELVQKFKEQLYQDKPLTIWVTVGGAGRSDAFSPICADEKLRKRLIQSVVNLCKKHSIQGVDLDYTPRTILDRDNYVVFLQEAIQIWHDAGLKVSMTTIFHPGMKFLSQINQQIDRLHLMTYDMISRDKDSRDPYHASLGKTKEMLEALLQPDGGLDISPEKILLGIPAYARHLHNPGNAKTFGEIFDAVLQEDGEDKSFVDWYSLYAWNGFEWESGERIRDKVSLAKEKGLGGIFFWELGQDKLSNQFPRGLLLETAAVAIHNKTVPERIPGNSNAEEL